MNALPDFPEALGTVADVAKLLRVSTSWVYKAVEAGHLPCIRVGAMIRFDLSAVKRFLTSQSPASEAQS